MSIVIVPVCQIGRTLEVAPGDSRTISFLTFLGDTYTYVTGNSDGRPSAFNNRGQLAFHAAFTDGSSGVFVSNRVAVPEPSTLLLSLAAIGAFSFIGCSRRRRNFVVISRSVNCLWLNGGRFAGATPIAMFTNASAATLYHIVRLGPPGGSSPYFLTEGGQVFGNSAPPVGLSGGQSVWVYNDTTTIDLVLRPD